MAVERARQGVVTVAATVVVLAGLRAAAGIAVPVVLALFLAFVSAPLVFGLERRRVPYHLAVTLVLLFAVLLLAAAALLVGGSLVGFQARLPTYRARLGELYAEAAHRLADLRVVSADHQSLSELVDPSSAVDLIGAAVSGIGAVIQSGVLVMLVLAFVLFDSKRIWEKVEARLGQRGTPELLGEVSRELQGYVRVKTVTSTVTGLALGIWCSALSVDFAVLWGFLAFLLNYVPTIGPLLAIVPPFLVSLVMLGPGRALVVAAGYLAVNFAVGNLLEPRVFGRALGLSPAVVILSIVVWGFVLGPVGALLSVPLTMIVRTVLANTEEWAWMADLMSGPRSDAKVAPVSEGE